MCKNDTFVFTVQTFLSTPSKTEGEKKPLWRVQCSYIVTSLQDPLAIKESVIDQPQSCMSQCSSHIPTVYSLLMHTIVPLYVADHCSPTSLLHSSNQTRLMFFTLTADVEDVTPILDSLIVVITCDTEGCGYGLRGVTVLSTHFMKFNELN